MKRAGGPENGRKGLGIIHSRSPKEESGILHHPQCETMLKTGVGVWRGGGGGVGGWGVGREQEGRVFFQPGHLELAHCFQP